MFFILGLLSLLLACFTFAQDTVVIGLDVLLTGSYADREQMSLKLINWRLAKLILKAAYGRENCKRD